MTAQEKVTVLGYDEMSVNGTIELDRRNDDVVGPHKELQVVSARGLFGKWKQPLFADFDEQMTKPLLDQIISRLHEIGFSVVAIVHDCAGGNLGLWRTVGIDYAEKSYMYHPVTTKEIFFFPDAPHLLKLMRNWLLDHGFMFKGNYQNIVNEISCERFFSGKMITKHFLIRLIQKASTLEKPFCKEQIESKNAEFNSLFKLTVRHVTIWYRKTKCSFSCRIAQPHNCRKSTQTFWGK